MAVLALLAVGSGRADAEPLYQLTVLGFLPGGTASAGYAVNAFGQVAGFAVTASGASHAFLSGPGGGALKDLGTLPGDLSSSSNAVNEAGQVVGYSANATAVLHVFLYSDGQLLNLNDLIPAGSGFTLVEAEGLNEAGQITGYGVTSAGASHAFLLTPVPAPASLVLMGLGLVDVAGLARRAPARRDGDRSD